MKYYSVTQILGVYFDWSKVPAETLYNAQERGKWVHNVCEAYVRGIPVYTQMRDDWSGYFFSFQAWYERFVRCPVITEQRLTDHVLKFHGKMDLLAELTDGRLALIDHKTPATESKTWKAQLAAYEHLCNLNDYKPEVVMSLMLDRSGRMPKAVIYKNTAEDFIAFTNALIAYRYFKE